MKVYIESRPHRPGLAAGLTALLICSCSQPVRIGVPGVAVEPAVVEEGVAQRPRADVLLDHALEAAERDTRASAGTRLASLNMTRSARDRIAAGELERAVDLLERAISVDGRGGFAYYYLAVVHEQLGHPRRSRNFAEQASALLPDDDRLHAELTELWRRAAAAQPE